MGELDTVQSAMLRVLFSARADEADVTSLAAPGERERVLLYRELARSRIRELMASALPRTSAALPDLPGRVERWLAIAPPGSRFFRDLPLTFAAHLLDALAERADDTPAYVPDLVRLESARWHAMIAVESTDAVVEFDLEKVPVPSATLTVLAPTWSVHLGGEPKPGRFYVSVYRRPDHIIETRWTDRVLGLLVEGWARAERPAIETVREALAAEALAPDHTFVDRMGEHLSTLLEGGALRGSRLSRHDQD